MARFPVSRGALALAAAAAAAAAVAILRRRIAVITVVGVSMQPAFASGDRVLVRRAAVSELRPGQVVVIEKPGDDGGWSAPAPSWPGTHSEWMIKRIAAVPGDPRPAASLPAMASAAGPIVPAGQVIVLGDNAARSYDSRQLGYFPAERLLGVVLRPIARR